MKTLTVRINKQTSKQNNKNNNNNNNKNKNNLLKCCEKR